jgi:hypothetical protein
MNNRRIGFDRELNLDWLDLTAGLVQGGLDIHQTRQELTARLANEVPGKEACRKTVTVLTRIWSRVPQEHQTFQAEALALLPRVAPEDRLWLHWGVSLLAYPFFHDVASTAGRLLNLQGEFESTQVLRRMQESWGQRTTLERAVPRLLRTFVNWNVTRAIPSAGHTYQATPPRQTSDAAVTLWLLECLLHDRQLPLAELIQSPAAFPFDLTDYAASVRRSDRFEVNRQGLDLEMVAPRAR